MQANGGTSEATIGVGNGNDVLPDIVPNPNAVQSSATTVNQAQTQPQQQLRPSTSPGPQQQLQHHHQQQQSQQSSSLSVPGPGIAPNQMGSGVQHQVSGGYHNQRHAQSYHNQQQQQQLQQHYHHQNKYNNPRGGDSESNINHVLLITVINPHYTITCDLIHQICSTYGKVNRIVIFKKNGVQAMVEFDNVESAKRAKSMLYGCDIYSGCCTLRIEYAKPTRLNIHKNDNDSFDYTNPNLASGPESGPGLNEHLQISSGSGGAHQTPHHSMHDSPHQTHGHHSRGGVGGGRSGSSSGGGGGGSGGGSGSSGHNQHHQPHQFQPSHHHPQSSTPNAHVVPQQQPPPVTATQHGVSNYGITSPIDQSPATTDAFHQDGGFNVSRGGPPQPPPLPPQSGYVGGESYMPAHGAPQGPTHGNMYPRQDGHQQQHQHHQHHHSRSGLGGGQNRSSSFSSANTPGALMSGPSNLASSRGTVMMVYGLQPERLNCDRLFNLFCLYGNVVRVKFLRTKEGCAMVQMGDVLAVDRCVSSLNKITLFGGELQISYSKQAFLHDVIQPFILPDGSPSFKDFMGNKNNRFKNPEVASKNRILPPSPVIHFFNAPYGITEDELVHLFKQTAGHEPITIKIFTPKGDNSKSFSGLVTFKDPAEATETLVLCNHLSMPKPGAPHPYILRLCFSPPTYNRRLINEC